MTHPALRRVAVSLLRSYGASSTPPDWLSFQVRAIAPLAPPDLSVSTERGAPFQWLRIASCFDFAADFEGARTILDELEDWCASNSEALISRELRALIFTRRGRIARQRGDVEAADEWYRAGLALCKGDFSGDAWNACLLGLANCAKARGNFVETVQYCREVLAAGNDVPAHGRCGAYLTLSVCYRRLGEIEKALEVAWAAYDLTLPQDERRAMALLTLSEIALARGHLEAAARGFEVLLRVAETERILTPTFTGALAVSFRRWIEMRRPASALESLLAQARRLVQIGDACHLPFERIQAHLLALEVFVHLQVATECQALSTRIRFELDELRSNGARLAEAELELARITDAVATKHHDPNFARVVATAPSSASESSQRSVARLLTLEIPASYAKA